MDVLQENFVIQCRMSNKPYDFFGTWYNDNYLLSGDLRWLAHFVSTSIVWLNRASQESDSEFTSIMNRMFKFYNRSASSIRSITVANCRSLPQQTATSSSPTPSSTSDDSTSGKVFSLTFCDTITWIRWLILYYLFLQNLHETGNPISHPELSTAESNNACSSKESLPETCEKTFFVFYFLFSTARWHLIHLNLSWRFFVANHFFRWVSVLEEKFNRCVRIQVNKNIDLLHLAVRS